MNSKLREILAQTHLRFWGIGFVLVLLAVLNLVWDLPVQRAGPAERQPQGVSLLQPAVFHAQDASPTPTEEVETTPTRTPLPAELLANYKQTTGIIIFAGVVVLIIVGGVFFQLMQERNSPT